MNYIDVAIKSKQPKALYALLMSRGIVSKKYGNPQDLPSDDAGVLAIWDESNFGRVNSRMETVFEDVDGYYRTMLRLTQEEYDSLPPSSIPVCFQEWTSIPDEEGGVADLPEFTYMRDGSPVTVPIPRIAT